MNHRAVGKTYDWIAGEYLEQRGIRIVERNYRCRFGEIDLIGYDQEILVFFEVKYRRDEKKGDPVEAVGYQKQRKICKVSDYYRMCHGVGEFMAMRYDVIGICGEKVTWYPGAFSYMG